MCMRAVRCQMSGPQPTGCGPHGVSEFSSPCTAPFKGSSPGERLVVRADKGRRAVWTYRVHGGDKEATTMDQNCCSGSDLRAAETRQANNAVASACSAERPRAMDLCGSGELAYGAADHSGVLSQWSTNDSTSYNYLPRCFARNDRCALRSGDDGVSGLQHCILGRRRTLSSVRGCIQVDGSTAVEGIHE